ncbi:hypothetical protein TRIATDRAFT_230982 [Trichoderma atroviride IMI 206040]|uniref:DUF7492 domain-containing protein n=2 Tax=Hypocrea atroviridis TaxID=63577 RepID=G9P9T6_HYPAI|nr:uncharacterized protein TRIATDRAFT_230982 [Trichoderma atroviride IMI 206040]EHK40408.1 hypothetical protein TRIATDRAFT_230982 [Trichoderma atroviride IMI 206040]
MLEAAAGDHIALIHLENGHTTLPQNQPRKPQNRGTIFLYGTSQPKENERLFDVHLVWNKAGTGGDKRGVLLGTRSYDDGNCYQPNNGALSIERAARLAPEGADHNTELGCQSTIQLPSDLKAGSVYTIYWYWDWPDLDATNIDFQATTNGLYPWAGTFMRGEKDPHGFTMAAISKNESYASTIDIKITGGGSSSAKHANINGEFIEKQNIYSMAIKDQMVGNFQVDIDANGGAKGGPGATPVTSTSAAPHEAHTSAARQGIAQPSAAPTGNAPEQPSKASASSPVVFVTTTIHTQAAAASHTHTPSTTTITSITTLAVTSTRTSDAQVAAPTVIVSVTKHVPAARDGEPTPTALNDRPTVTPLNRRRNWAFGQH